MELDARVLLIDSDPVESRLIAAQLGKRCDTNVVTSRHQAECAIPSQTWNGMLIDISTSEEDGRQLLHIARSRLPRIPIIIMSSSGRLAASGLAFLHGAYFVAKPLPSGWAERFMSDMCSRSVRLGVYHELEQLGLTRAELSVFERLARGAEAAAVARELHLAVSTVRNHTARVYKRFGAHSLPGLLELARREAARGSLEPPSVPDAHRRYE